MDRAPAPGGLSVGQRFSLLIAGSDLRTRVCGASESHGHRAGALVTTLTVATRLYGTSHRLHSPRVPGPCHCLRRRLAPPHARRVLRLLSSVENPSLTRQGQPAITKETATRGGTDDR